MDPQWDDSQPIYRQLRDRVVAMILEGVLKEGDPLPSVRAVAAEFRLNPLTVLKGYQQLVDEQLVEKRRGRGMFVNTGLGAAPPGIVVPPSKSTLLAWDPAKQRKVWEIPQPGTFNGGVLATGGHLIFPGQKLRIPLD